MDCDQTLPTQPTNPQRIEAAMCECVTDGDAALCRCQSLDQ